MRFKKVLCLGLFLLVSIACGGAHAWAQDCCVVRGDINDIDGKVDISDLVYLVTYLFQGGPAPPCLAAADLNDDGDVNIADLTLFVFCMFVGPEPGFSEELPCWVPCP